MIVLQGIVVAIGLLLVWASVLSRRLPRGIIEWAIWIVAIIIVASWIR